MKDNLSDLEKKQMEIIDKLQEKINLQKFDISQLRKEKSRLKRSLILKKQAMRNSIKEIEKIKKNETYNEIIKVLMMLKGSLGEKE